MCGIVGIVGKIPYPNREELIKKMYSLIRHRGPDSDGIYIDEDITLGAVRLKIIDLISGEQPIHNEDRTIWTVFNGEIYNFLELRKDLEANGHSFYTNTDTEVIPHLYEDYSTEFVNFLNGMFALAIWDKKNKILLLCRDRVGIKPLYYLKENDFLIFASEVTPISYACKNINYKLDIDEEALDDYLSFLYIPHPKSIYKQIKKLSPACMLIYKPKEEDKKYIIKKYWHIIYKPQKDKKSQNFIDEFYYLFEDAVKKTLISDVAVGVFLSGGLDSSAIAAVLSKLKATDIYAFCCGFPKELGYYDESKFAKKVAQRLNIKYYDLKLTSQLHKIEEEIEQMSKFFDEPFGDASSLLLYLLAKEAKKFFTVGLSGTGADDIFAGYRRYTLDKIFNFYKKLPSLFRKGIISLQDYLPLPISRKSYIKECGLLLKKFLSTLRDNSFKNISAINLYLSKMTFFSSSMKEKLYKPEIKERIEGYDFWSSAQLYINNSIEDFINKVLFIDMNSYLVDDLLVKEDRTLMANSMEGRFPYLDHRLIEFAANLPVCFKINRFTTKFILKKAAQKYLNIEKNIIYRKKHGFALPLCEWLKDKNNKFYKFLDERLCAKEAKVSSFFNTEYIKKLLIEHELNRADYSEHLFALLMFELWLNKT